MPTQPESLPQARFCSFNVAANDFAAESGKTQIGPGDICGAYPAGSGSALGTQRVHRRGNPYLVIGRIDD